MNDFTPRPAGRQLRFATLAEIAADRPPSIPVKRDAHAKRVWGWALAAVRYGTVPENPTMEETARFVLDTPREAENATAHVLPPESPL